MKRSCDLCGVTYEAKSPKSKYHSPNCRLKAHEQRKAGKVVELPAREDDAPEGLVATVRAELEQAGRSDTYLGKSALVLAGQVEAGGHTGSALAALNREFRAVMAEAVKGVATPQSAVAKHRDELAARRRA